MSLLARPRAGAAAAGLPEPPTDSERVAYVRRDRWLLLPMIVAGFSGISYGLVRLALALPLAGALLAYWCFVMASFALSLYANFAGRDFDLAAHDRFIEAATSDSPPSVDVFVPTCGEAIEVLENTFAHVARLSWPGDLRRYCLDDAGRPEVHAAAEAHGFTYLARPDAGRMKKAGNLQYGFERSSGEVVCLFDADFVPRPDLLRELVPYLLADERVGIVQTAQYFRVCPGQHWIERGAAEVQEYFYRLCQWSRHHHGAAVCCGTNALYRRSALEENGGITQVPQGEDMRTGFDLQRLGWRVAYLPLNLAAGLCPGDLAAYFKQQYRWCTGSLRLLADERFWAGGIAPSERLCYLAGFNYYLQSAVQTFALPVLMVTLLALAPGHFTVAGERLVVPAIALLVGAYPLWHRCRYGPAAWTARLVCQWSHLFALADFCHERVIPWDATGSGEASVASTARFRQFRALALGWGLVASTAWVALAGYRLATGDGPAFAVVTAMGLFSAWNALRLAAAFWTRGSPA